MTKLTNQITDLLEAHSEELEQLTDSNLDEIIESLNGLVDLLGVTEEAEKVLQFIYWCLYDVVSTAPEKFQMTDYWCYFHAAFVHNQNGPMN